VETACAFKLSFFACTALMAILNKMKEKRVDITYFLYKNKIYFCRMFEQNCPLITLHCISYYFFEKTKYSSQNTN